MIFPNHHHHRLLYNNKRLFFFITFFPVKRKKEENPDQTQWFFFSNVFICLVSLLIIDLRKSSIDSIIKSNYRIDWFYYMWIFVFFFFFLTPCHSFKSFQSECSMFLFPCDKKKKLKERKCNWPHTNLFLCCCSYRFWCYEIKNGGVKILLLLLSILEVFNNNNFVFQVEK